MDPKIGPIAVPLDGSAFSEEALPWAVSLAQRRGCVLQLIRVISADIEAGIGVQDVEAELFKIAARIRRAKVPCDVHVAVGDPASQILGRARDDRAALVTLAVREGLGLGEPGLGNTVARLVQRATVPVIVQPEAMLRRGRPFPEGGPILVPFDGSERSEMAVAEAMALAETFKVDVLLLRAIDPARGFEPELPPNSYVENAIDEITEGYLWGIAEWVRRHGIEARIAYGRAEPATFILDQARREKASLICMASRGESGPVRLDPGRVAKTVLRGADVPVLLVGPLAIEGRRSPIAPKSANADPPFRGVVAPGAAFAPGVRVGAPAEATHPPVEPIRPRTS